MAFNGYIGLLYAVKPFFSVPSWKNVEKRENGCFSGRLWLDWGNTAWAAMAGLGSIGFIDVLAEFHE